MFCFEKKRLSPGTGGKLHAERMAHTGTGGARRRWRAELKIGFFRFLSAGRAVSPA
jgi:hypothetical protein